jgi:hypothetical protein
MTLKRNLQSHIAIRIGRSLKSIVLLQLLTIFSLMMKETKHCIIHVPSSDAKIDMVINYHLVLFKCRIV